MRTCRTGESLATKSAKSSSTLITSLQLCLPESHQSARSLWLTLCSSQRPTSRTKTRWPRVPLCNQACLRTCRRTTTSTTLWKARARAPRLKRRAVSTYRMTINTTPMIGGTVSTSCLRPTRHQQRAKAIKRAKSKNLSLDCQKRASRCLRRALLPCLRPVQRPASKTLQCLSASRPSTAVFLSSQVRARIRPPQGLNRLYPPLLRTSNSETLLFKIG